jgi:hypothetical protein
MLGIIALYVGLILAEQNWDHLIIERDTLKFHIIFFNQKHSNAYIKININIIKINTFNIFI